MRLLLLLVLLCLLCGGPLRGLFARPAPSDVAVLETVGVVVVVAGGGDGGGGVGDT